MLPLLRKTAQNKKDMYHMVKCKRFLETNYVYITGNPLIWDTVYCFQGGSIVRLFHNEMESYMAAEGVFGKKFTENGEQNIKIQNQLLITFVSLCGVLHRQLYFLAGVHFTCCW